MLDLSAWDFDEKGNVRLDGIWEFYPDQLGALEKTAEANAPLYVKIPSALHVKDKGPFSAEKYHGCGTYRLVVRMPAHHGQTALYVKRIFSSAEIAVNGKTVYTAGKTGVSRDTSFPALKPAVIPLADSTYGEMEIICRVSNYQNYKGGILSGICLGDAEKIYSYSDLSSRYGSFIFGVFFIVALYHLSLYTLRTKEKFTLYFGLACGSYAVRIFFSDTIPALNYWPGIPWEILMKIQYISYYAAVLFFVNFLRSLFPGEFPRGCVFAVDIVLTVFSVITLAAPARIYSFYLSKPFELFAFVSLLCVVIFLLRAVWTKKEGSALILAGVIVLAAASVNDMLYTSQIVNTGYLVVPGFLIFIFTQAFALAIKFANSFYSVERLSQEIGESKEKLHEMLTRLADAEKHSTINTLVAGIAHDVSSPLGLSLTAISFLDDKTKNAGLALCAGKADIKDFEAYVLSVRESSDIVISNLNRANELLRSFKELVSNQYNEQRQFFNVKSCLDDIILSVKPRIKKGRHDINVICPDLIAFESYPGAFAQIIINLFLNSVIHGFEGRTGGVITINAAVKNGRFHLTYSDDGRGIAPEHLPVIFDPFFTTNRESGCTGLGMHIVKTAL
ncbi:MAG: 7TM diverse intracellular signaling domain-containing protein, partial [Spirochaetota bacterium]